MLHLLHKNNKTKILIEDSCDQNDTEKLLQLFEQKSNIEISFISISVLSSNVIKGLSCYKNKLKLSTNDRTLWNYLRKISINIKLEGIVHKSNKKNIPLKAIGIGGSAGALRNIIKIVKELPYSDIVMFIVVHILPDEKNQLVDILQQCTNYKVKEAKDGEQIKQNHIYIASPNLHMIVQDGCIYHLKIKKVNFCKPSIDVLFKSLASEYQESLVTILTCGYLDDGTKSLKNIINNNGIIIIQNPNECEANDIPLNAIITKNYTYIFDIDDINTYIKSRLNTIINLEDRISEFIYKIYKVYGDDFRGYDKKSIKRRVELFRKELRINSFSDFEELVLSDTDIFKSLFKKLSINVSNFFRDPEVFKQIREDIVPILKTYPSLRIWCSACSTGQEPYSVALLLDEVGLLEKSIIYATDFNNTVLQQAKNGIFPKNSFIQFKKDYIQSGGKEDFNKWFEINDDYVEIDSLIKNKVHFFQHNLVTDGIINEFHIVFCRNVLIYFDKKLQEKVFKLIYDSLIRNCFLILGKSETVNIEDGFKKSEKYFHNKIFQKG